MFDIKSAAQHLDHLLHEIVVKNGIFVPINKDLIKYKNYTMKRTEDREWLVWKTVNNKKHFISKVCLKVSAFAICKLDERRNNAKIAEVESYDKIFQKNYIDSLFYKKTFQTTQNEISRDNALWRYEIASSQAQLHKKKIDAIFYALIV